MRILLTNDDGIEAPGLHALQQIASELSKDVWTIAPDTDQSGAAHSLTLHEPLRCREVGKRIYAVKGTPTDCIIMGVKHILAREPPDLVLSGVNRGVNVADDVTYSGTIAGAIEGTLLGIPSVALSLATRMSEDSDRVKWETPMRLGADLIRRLLAAGWPKDVLVNVNFPDREPGEVEGTLVTRQGKRDQNLLTIVDRMDTRGNPYYWFGFERRRSNPPEGTDLWAIYRGYISVTPLHLDLTHASTLERLARALGP
jgi:5'-nucleotidase